MNADHVAGAVVHVVESGTSQHDPSSDPPLLVPGQFSASSIRVLSSNACPPPDGLT